MSTPRTGGTLLSLLTFFHTVALTSDIHRYKVMKTLLKIAEAVF